MPTLRQAIRFYVEGFRAMTLGRTLWASILVKLFVMFAEVRLLFFPDPLAGKRERARGRHEMRELTERERPAETDPQKLPSET